MGTYIWHPHPHFLKPINQSFSEFLIYRIHQESNFIFSELSELSELFIHFKSCLIYSFCKFTFYSGFLCCFQLFSQFHWDKMKKYNQKMKSHTHPKKNGGKKNVTQLMVIIILNGALGVEIVQQL